MNKIKYILLLVCIAGCFAACKKDTPEFDHLAQFKIDTVLIRNFINEKGLQNVQKDGELGIFYQILAPGTEDVITKTSTVTADYEGRLLDGKVFESATNQTFPINQVIPSWQFGLPLIKKGGTIRIIAPSFYGYRNIANEKIPANSVLDFTVTVKDVAK